MVDCIRETIEKYQVNPQRLQVELTETSVINSSSSARKNIESLVEMGLALAMDDFGTGYSSIDLLSQWPFSVVKIDQGLIQRMITSEKSTTIVQASIRMVHQLGIKVVAEGIETGESLFLRKLVLGIQAQASGKYLTRPFMPAAPRPSCVRCVITSSRLYTTPSVTLRRHKAAAASSSSFARALNYE
ncbi:EAL domain-containing protein [Candidatus Reidiella endopervernicosa]